MTKQLKKTTQLLVALAIFFTSAVHADTAPAFDITLPSASESGLFVVHIASDSHKNSDIEIRLFRTIDGGDFITVFSQAKVNALSQSLLHSGVYGYKAAAYDKQSGQLVAESPVRFVEVQLRSHVAMNYMP